MKLVLGLGNPGEYYKMHRHNIGFILLDRLARNLNVELDTKKKKTVFGEGKENGTEFLLLKPLTFMNLCGEAALYMASFRKIKVEDIIVLCDDTNLPLGKFKVVKGGKDGEHSGIKSLSNSLKNPNFTRIYIGIGKPKRNQDLGDYVLSPFTKEERETLRGVSNEIIHSAKECIFGPNETSKKRSPSKAKRSSKSNVKS